MKFSPYHLTFFIFLVHRLKPHTSLFLSSTSSQVSKHIQNLTTFYQLYGFHYLSELISSCFPIFCFAPDILTSSPTQKLPQHIFVLQSLAWYPYRYLEHSHPGIYMAYFQFSQVLQVSVQNLVFLATSFKIAPSRSYHPLISDFSA